MPDDVGLGQEFVFADERGAILGSAFRRKVLAPGHERHAKRFPKGRRLCGLGYTGMDTTVVTARNMSPHSSVQYRGPVILA